jgi:hypothetical protein
MSNICLKQLFDFVKWKEMKALEREVRARKQHGVNLERLPTALRNYDGRARWVAARK